MSAPTFLVFDVETNDLPDFKLPADHPQNAYIVQIGALLLDGDFNELAELDCLISPEGWRIAPGAQNAHGISLERCHAEGIPISAVMTQFDTMADAVAANDGTLVAFNIRFDNKLVRGARRRLGRPDRFGLVREFDAMRASHNLCRLPPTAQMLKYGRTGFKTPKLEEAHRILCGSEMSGAHDALSDVRATVNVMRALRDKHGVDIRGERPASYRGAAE